LGITRAIIAANIHLLRRDGNILTKELCAFCYELCRDLLKRIIAYGDTRYARAIPIEHCAKQHAGNGAAAASRADHAVDLHPGGFGLAEHFFRAIHIAERSERNAAAYRHKIGLMAGYAQLISNPIHFNINVIVAVRIHKTHIYAHKRFK